MKQKRFHIIIDITEIKPAILNNQASLKTFLSKLPAIIDMHILTGPFITHGIPENPGLSGFVLIDYSHISIHSFANYNEALVDIFSCKPFDKQKAITAVLDHFHVPSEKTRIQEVFWG